MEIDRDAYNFIQSLPLAGTDVVFEAPAMVDVPTMFARVGVPEFEGEDLGGVVAEVAEAALASLADFALVEVALQDGEVLFNLSGFMSVVDVEEVLKTEKVAFEAVVEPFGEGLVHVLRVTNTVVHQMDLPLQHQEVVQDLVLEHHLLVVPQLHYRHLKVQLNALERSPTDRIPSQVELVLRLVGDLDPLAGHVLVAKPLTSIVAQVYIAPENIEPVRQVLPALRTLLVVLAYVELVAERVSFVLKDLQLIFKLLNVQKLRIFHPPRFLVPTLRSIRLPPVVCLLLCLRLWRRIHLGSRLFGFLFQRPFGLLCLDEISLLLHFLE